MKLLLWDFDGTLGFRQGGSFSAALIEAMYRAGVGPDATVDQIRPHLRAGFPWHTPERPHPGITTADAWWEPICRLFERALADFGLPSSKARALAREVRSAYVDPCRWALFEDTLPVLDVLTRAGWCHAVLSNHVPELRGIVRHLGLEPHLAALFSSAETGYEKPHPRAFEIALERFPDAGPVWMIGDSLEADVKGARAVGIAAILARGEGQSGLLNVATILESAR